MESESRTFKALFQPAEGRKEIVRNEVYSVFPVVALVEGVLHPSNSTFPELALAREFGALPASWDGVPVVLSHPSIDGVPVSANSPAILGTNTMGFMFGTHLEDKKLKGEIWINRKWAAENGQTEILNTLDAGQPLEVSTGLFARVDQVPGMYNGEAYAGIWRNVLPDHLAILPPGVKGACSIEDGCGIPRINNDGELPMTTATTQPETPPAVTTATGCTCPNAEQPQAPTLEANTQPEEKVVRGFFAAIANLLKTSSAPEATTQVETPPETPPEPTANTETPTEEPKTLEAFFATAPEGLKADVNSLLALRSNVIAGLSNQILACSNNSFTKEELDAMSVPQLEKLAQLAKGSATQSTAEPPDFSGRGASRDSNQGADPGYTAPMLVFPRKTANKE